MNTGQPTTRGLYVALLDEPLDRGFWPHLYVILEWSGDGTATTLPARWSHPYSGRQVPEARVVGWLGPLAEPKMRVERYDPDDPPLRRRTSHKRQSTLWD